MFFFSKKKSCKFNTSPYPLHCIFYSILYLFEIEFIIYYFFATPHASYTYDPDVSMFDTRNFILF
jgi:hypothetical protein